MQHCASAITRVSMACLCTLALSGGAGAQTASDYSQGVSVNGSTATIWFKPASSATSWVDVHYNLDGGALQNLRMTWNASTGRDEINVFKGVVSGDSVGYSFTYNKGAPAYDSASYSYTVGGSQTSGPVCFYQDINYTGASFCASADSGWVGNDWNDRISSVKVASGQQVTLFGDINFGGSALTLTGDTPNLVPLNFNDAASSFKIGANNGGGGGTWNKQTTFNIVNNTHGAFDDGHVYWAIIGRDWNTGKFVSVDAGGHFVPMSTADNGALSKGGQPYSNYFHSIAQSRSVTIPPINSARMYLSVGSPMFIKVVQGADGLVGYAGANIENPSDPNIDVTFDFVEMAIVPDSGIFANTTRVDQFGFPVTLRVQGLGGFDQTVGETETRGALISAYQAAVPSDFQSLAGSHLPYRIVAPAHGNFGAGQAESHYLDNYINQLWSRYTHDTLTFTDQQGTFSGHVVNGAFQFSDGKGTYTIAHAPSTPEALLGNGVLNDASGQTPGTPGYDKQLQIQAQLCAAINRHIVEDPAHWYTQSAQYPAGQPANSFAKFWHDHGVNHLAYGFAYDDVGNFSSSIHTGAPTVATVTIGW